jgi:hypothetical protein
MLRRSLTVLLLALACSGCSAPSPTGSADPAVQPPERWHVTWDNVTSWSQCVDPTCRFTERFEFAGTLTHVGRDLWINVTWESNHASNDELTLSIDPPGDALPEQFQGPSPLHVHLDAPGVTLEIRLTGKDATFGALPPPDQPFHLEASYLAK